MSNPEAHEGSGPPNLRGTNPWPLAQNHSFTRREAIRRAALILGVAISPSILSGVLRAQDAKAVAAVPERPQYLSRKLLTIAGGVADRIIPRTDTPGALDVGVLTFMDLCYGEFMNEDEREQFTNGLNGIEAASFAAYRRAFVSLTSERQDRVLTAWAETSAESGNPFFLQVKELTILGYFTSEEVAKNILRYEPVPGPFQGCISVSEVGKATWMPLR